MTSVRHVDAGRGELAEGDDGELLVRPGRPPRPTTTGVVRRRGAAAAAQRRRRAARSATGTPGCTARGRGRPRPACSTRSRDHLPRLEPVRQADHAVVVAQRGPGPGRDRLGGGDARQHRRPATSAQRSARLGGLLEHGGRHREHAGIAGGDDRDPAPCGGQVERQRGPLGLDRVARRVPALPGPDRDPGQVGPVADQVGGVGERRRAASGVSQAGIAGSEPDDASPPGRLRPARCPRPGHQRQRHVGHAGRVDPGQRRDAARLSVPARSTYRARSSSPACRPARHAPCRTSGRA